MVRRSVILLLASLIFFACDDPSRVDPRSKKIKLSDTSVDEGFVLTSPKLDETLSDPAVIVNWDVLTDSPEPFFIYVSQNPTFEDVHPRHWHNRSRNHRLGVFNSGTYYLKLIRGSDSLISKFMVEDYFDWEGTTYVDSVVVTEHDAFLGQPIERDRYLDTMYIVKEGQLFRMKFDPTSRGIIFDEFRIDNDTYKFTNRIDYNEADYFGAEITLNTVTGSVSACRINDYKVVKTVSSFQSE
ncbi:MAG: hypothetical protein AB8F95_01515 [Bacteroidia bacterium]